MGREEKVLARNRDVLRGLPNVKDVCLGYRGKQKTILLTADQRTEDLKDKIDKLRDRLDGVDVVVLPPIDDPDPITPSNPFLPLIEEYGSIRAVQRLDNLESRLLNLYKLRDFRDLMDRARSPIFKHKNDIKIEPHLALITNRSDLPFMNQGVEVFDPVQGRVNDCGLISSLASLAWANPEVIKAAYRAEDPAYPFCHDFYLNGTGTMTTVCTSGRVLMGQRSSGSYGPIFASSFTGEESWPSLFEKGFVLFANQTVQAEVVSGEPKDSHYYNIAQYPKVETYLLELTNWTMVSEEWSATDEDESVISTLAEDCQSEAELEALAGGDIEMRSVIRKTICPMVVTTANSYEGGVGDELSAFKMAVSHAYSLLGYITTDDGSYHVLLRDPFGAKITSESGEDRLPGPLFHYDRTRGEWRTMDLVENDGIFSLPIAHFKRFFSGAVGVRSDWV